MYRFLLKLVILQAFFALTLQAPVFAANPSGNPDLIPSGTVLPETKLEMYQCEQIMRDVNGKQKEVKKAIAERTPVPLSGGVSINDILGCAIKTGDIKLWMIAFYIRYLLEFVIGLVGLISVGGIIYGGYFYLFSGLTEDKEKGKNAIKNAIIGIVLSLSAWAIVNIVISLVTG
jgi:hypothetical protein